MNFWNVVAEGMDKDIPDTGFLYDILRNVSDDALDETYFVNEVLEFIND